MLSLWKRLPIVLRASVAGAVVALAESGRGSSWARRIRSCVAHHPGAVLPMLPFCLAAAVYGGLARLSDSILPGVVLHTGGDVFVGRK